MAEVPLVSVGIPCYNRPEGLRRTLECITCQTYKNLEIIISDNCSPNSDVERVGRDFAEKDSRVRYIRQIKNNGAAHNFKYVLQAATGEYFMWASDDDEYAFDFIERCLDVFSSSENLVCVSCLVDRFESKESQKYLLSYDYYSNIGKSTYNRLKEVSSIVVSGKKRIATLICGVYYREVISRLEIKSQYGGDLLLLVEISRFGEFTTVSETKLIKYGPRKTVEELKEYFDEQTPNNANPYNNFTKTVISIINESIEITKWEKLKLGCIVWFTYLKYRTALAKILIPLTFKHHN